MINPQPQTVSSVAGVAAEQGFERRFAGGHWARLRSRLAGSTSCLLSLQKVRDRLNVKAQHYAGVRSVPVDKIEGSEGRPCDYTSDFRPRQAYSRNRWIAIATAILTGRNLPPVELIQVKDRYFVRDGHHRVSVARAFGQTSIDAQVTVWEVAQEEAS